MLVFQLIFNETVKSVRMFITVTTYNLDETRKNTNHLRCAVRRGVPMTGLEAGPGVLMQGVEKDRSENVSSQQVKKTRVNYIRVEVKRLLLFVTSDFLSAKS